MRIEGDEPTAAINSIACRLKKTFAFADKPEYSLLKLRLPIGIEQNWRSFLTRCVQAQGGTIVDDMTKLDYLVVLDTGRTRSMGSLPMDDACAESARPRQGIDE